VIIQRERSNSVEGILTAKKQKLDKQMTVSIFVTYTAPAGEDGEDGKSLTDCSVNSGLELQTMMY